MRQQPAIRLSAIDRTEIDIASAGQSSLAGSVQSFTRAVARDLLPILRKRSLTTDAAGGPVVLLEMAKLASFQIAHAYLAAALAVEHGARIVAYRFVPRRSLRQRVAAAMRGARSTQPADAMLDIYRSFCDGVLELSPTALDERDARARAEEFFARSPDLTDLERFAVDGATLGDLILDKHVQVGNPAIRIDHPGVAHLVETLAARALRLHRYFDSHAVVAVISSGLAVSPGLPLRVALAHDVPAYPATFDFVWRLTPERPNWNREYATHRSDFARLSPNDAVAARARAEAFLTESLEAEGRGGNNLGSTSAWARRALPPGFPVKRPGTRTVLVAAHSFSDSPHSIGTTLFPDFYSWLEHLAGIASRTDYEWLFKLHPDERDRHIGVLPDIQRLLATTANAHIIPSDTSHWALLERGVDLALTVYGSIAVEYPSLGVPAIIAWPDGFVSGYSFALRPSSVEEYDRLLLDPATWDYDIPRDELLEYVYCHYLWPRRPGVFQRVPAIAALGQDDGSFKEPQFADLWASEATAEDAAEVLRVHREWVRSQTYSRNAFDQ